MKSKLLSRAAEGRTYAVVLDDGEEAFEAVRVFAAENDVDAASLSAIGAFSGATVGWFDFQRRAYREIPVAEQCEVLSFIGDLAAGDDGKPSLHAHAVLGLSDGTTRGGHFLRGIVHPTLEIIVSETARHLRRTKRPELGIAMIDLSKD